MSFKTAVFAAALSAVLAAPAFAACTGPFVPRTLESFGAFSRAGDHQGKNLVVAPGQRCPLVGWANGVCLPLRAWSGPVPSTEPPAYARPAWVKTDLAEVYDRERAVTLWRKAQAEFALQAERERPTCSAAEWGLLQLDAQMLGQRAKALSTLSQQANGALPAGATGG